MTDDDVIAFDRAHVLTPWQKLNERRRVAIAGAKGNYFWDTDGKRYLDFTSGFVFANIGHGDERVVEAIAAQARTLATVASPFASRPKSELARLVAEVTPGDLNTTFFCTSGAEANEAAIKIVRAATGRDKIVSRYNSYHGSTYGAMALSRDPRSWPFEPAIPGVVYALPCYPYRCRLCRGGCTGACVEQFEDIIRYSGGENYVAGVIVEPVTGGNGVIVPPDGYMQRLREICDKHRVLLIADEVMTGFGRTGKWFAMEHWGVVPDVMTVAKGITSGYVPLSATIVRDEIAEYFERTPWTHGHTYSGHPLACAAGVATIQVYHEDGLVERAAELGVYLLAAAQELMGKHKSIGEVRGLGLFVGIEMVRDRESREPLMDGTEPAGAALKAQVLARLLQEGVYMLGGYASALVLAPPLTITREEIDAAMAALDQALLIADQAAN